MYAGDGVVEGHGRERLLELHPDLLDPEEKHRHLKNSGSATVTLHCQMSYRICFTKIINYFILLYYTL